MDKLMQILKESKKVKTTYPINEMSLYRWSPRAFTNKTIERSQLLTMMEAARWAPSSYNEQPWRFVVAMRGEAAFDKMLSTMVDFNRSWAKDAAALILNVYKKNLTQGGKPNTAAALDLGQAIMSYCFEAENQGLHTHQIGGYDVAKADELFGCGEDYSSMVITAVGYLGNPNDLPEELFKVELQNRFRKPMEAIVFEDKMDGTAFVEK